MPRTFEYAKFGAYRSPTERDGTGAWKVNLWWQQGGTTTKLEGEEADFMVALDRYGAQGWELVGPPEVSVYVSSFASVDPADTSKHHWMDWGDWVTKVFWMKRETLT